MTVSEIIKAVRWCLDEEQTNLESLADVTANDSTFMDNIIKAKINDALRWVCLYAPANLLNSGSSSSTDGIVSTKTYTATALEGTIGVIKLDSTPLRIVRVMSDKWHRGVLEPFAEDSDEFAMMWDDPENGTADLPRVGLVNTVPPTLYVQPKDGTFTIQVVNAPSEASATSGDTDIAIPEKCKTAFLYYIAYLVMIAYENQAKATMCYQVAVQNLSLQKTTSNGNG